MTPADRHYEHTLWLQRHDAAITGLWLAVLLLAAAVGAALGRRP